MFTLLPVVLNVYTKCDSGINKCACHHDTILAVIEVLTVSLSECQLGVREHSLVATVDGCRNRREPRELLWRSINNVHHIDQSIYIGEYR